MHTLALQVSPLHSNDDWDNSVQLTLVLAVLVDGSSSCCSSTCLCTGHTALPTSSSNLLLSPNIVQVSLNG